MLKRSSRSGVSGIIAESAKVITLYRGSAKAVSRALWLKRARLGLLSGDLWNAESENIVNSRFCQVKRFSIGGMPSKGMQPP